MRVFSAILYVPMINGAKMKKLFINMIGLFITQFGNMIAPILIIPCLSRATSAQEMGVTLFSLSFVAWLSLFVEYGFSLSGSREIAQMPDKKRQIFSNVQTTKIALSIGCVFVALLVGLTLPIYNGKGDYMLVTIFLGVIIGMNPIWYFQGIQNVLIPSVIDMLGTSIWILLVLFLSPEKEAGLFSLYSLLLIKFFIYGGGVFFLVARLGMEWIGFDGIIKELKKGGGLFIFRLAISIYTTGNVVLLGYLVPPAQVGFFVAAERIAKAANSILFPVVNALYPKISSLVGNDDKKIIVINRLSILVMVFFTSIFLGLIYTIGDFIIYLLLGEEAQGVMPILKIVAWAVPLIAISNVLGFQCLIPRNYEKCVNSIMFFTAGINVIFAILLTKIFGISGMAWNMVVIEFFVLAQMLILIVAKRIEI